MLAGVIDSDYRGEILCALVNHGREAFEIEPGARVAQLVVEAIATPDPAFTTLEAEDFRQAGRSVVVIDFWRLLSKQLSRCDGIEYVPYGHAPATLPAGILEELWGDADPVRARR